MLRTSRCFAGTLLQLGGPDALSSVVRYPYLFQFADFPFARIALFFRTKFFSNTCALRFNAIRKLGPKFATAKRSTARNLGGNLAMRLVAIG